MKTKVIESSIDGNTFEHLVNDFIQNKKVTDIKFNSFLCGNYARYVALIIYEEE